MTRLATTKFVETIVEESESGTDGSCGHQYCVSGRNCLSYKIPRMLKLKITASGTQNLIQNDVTSELDLKKLHCVCCKQKRAINTGKLTSFTGNSWLAQCKLHV